MLFCFCYFISFGQRYKIDSLRNGIKYGKDDTNKVNKLLFLSRYTLGINGKYSQSDSIAECALAIAKKLNFTTGMVNVYIHFGTSNSMKGNIPGAVENFLKAIKISEKTGYINGLARSYNLLGETYEVIKEDSTALSMEKKASELAKKMGSKFILASSQNDIGRLYAKMGDTTNALKMQMNSIKLFTELKDTIDISFMYRDIGNIFKMQKNYDQAQEYYLKAIKYGGDFMKPSAYNELGDLFLKQEQYSIALEYANKSMIFAQERDSKEAIKSASKTLSSIYEKTGNHKKALEFYKLFNSLEDSIYGPNSMARVNKNALNYALLAAKEAEDKKEIEHQAQLQQQKIIIYSVSFGFILILTLAFFIFRGYKQKQKANELIAKKNKDILDSIRYAKRIQTSLLPTHKYIDRILSEKDQSTGA